MPDRIVKLGLATYIGEDGATRYGRQGETVTVHPDHVKRFDEVNAPPKDTAPKRRGRPPPPQCHV